jgi:hypothetical protein
MSEVPPLRTCFVVGGQLAQRDGKRKEIERSDKQFIVICRNVEQCDPSGTGTLVVASVLEPTDRESGSGSKKRLN